MIKLIILLGLAAMALATTDSYGNHGRVIANTTMQLLREAYNLGEDKNVVASPLSFMILLALFNSGAHQNEITRFLGGPHFESLYKNLSLTMSKQDAETLTVANKVYVASKYNLKESFTSAVQSFSCSEVDKLDFGNADAAAATINQWINEKTRGLMKDSIKSDMLSADILTALFNVIYFKGHWEKPFHPKITRNKDFHISKDQVVQKPTMYKQEYLSYRESPELGARLLGLRYKETSLEMVIVLPNEIDGLSSVLEKAAEKGIIDGALEKLNEFKSHVIVELPKFEVRSSLDLNKIAPKLGLPNLFREPASGLVEGGSVILSRVFQDAFIKVDEKGTTAAAATAGQAGGISLLIVTYQDFKVDHPFLYIIKFEDKILFAGTYVH